jgi:thiol-disulfide isomerase/thioredoxin
MNVRKQCSGAALVLLVGIQAVAGCSKTDQASDRPPYAASAGSESSPDQRLGESTAPDQTGEGASGGKAPRISNEGIANQPIAAEPIPAGDPDNGSSTDSSAGQPFSRMLPPEGARDVATPFTIEGSEPAEPQTSKLTELRADLTPKQLLEFLSAADADMQLIVTGRSGIEDPRQARRTLMNIVKMKLEASRRLMSHADSTDQGRSEGARGELQSLSHLAALGDLKAAEELESLAQARLASDDPQLVADSRLVLIGFAIEALQGGEEGAADRIVQYVEQVAASPTPPDVAAMMVMGEARELLEKYGQQQQARLVRDRIIELFADSPEPQIADMAARLAGSVRFDEIDTLLTRATEGDSLDVTTWVQAAESLIKESADLQTVKYLAGAALEFEARGRSELVEATYECLRSRFTDASAATTQEMTMAYQAYQARQSVIGQMFSPDLDSVEGGPLSLQDYRGKVVLVPFWAMNFPQSMQVFPQLRAIVDRHPDQVAMVGVNLDAEAEPVAEFVKQSQLGFSSFRAAGEMTNQIAMKFGIVSMPFTAILDKEGRVEAIDFTGKKLDATIDRLLSP